MQNKGMVFIYYAILMHKSIFFMSTFIDWYKMVKSNWENVIKRHKNVEKT